MISTTSEYALRALVYMARLPRGAAVLGRDLAESTGIPANYLSKVLLSLRNAGILDTARGAGGGYRLHKPADEIFLIDVVEVFEGRRSRPTCLLYHDKACKERGQCSAHAAWREISMAYTGFLLATSVASIAGGHGAAAAPVAAVEPSRAGGRRA